MKIFVSILFIQLLVSSTTLAITCDGACFPSEEGQTHGCLINPQGTCNIRTEDSCTIVKNNSGNSYFIPGKPQKPDWGNFKNRSNKEVFAFSECAPSNCNETCTSIGAVRVNDYTNKVELCEAGCWAERDVLAYCLPPAQVKDNDDEYVRFKQDRSVQKVAGSACERSQASKISQEDDHTKKFTDQGIKFDDNWKKCKNNTNCELATPYVATPPTTPPPTTTTPPPSPGPDKCNGNGVCECITNKNGNVDSNTCGEGISKAACDDMVGKNGVTRVAYACAGATTPGTKVATAQELDACAVSPGTPCAPIGYTSPNVDSCGCSNGYSISLYCDANGTAQFRHKTAVQGGMNNCL